MIARKQLAGLILLFALMTPLVLSAQHKPFQFGFKGAVNLGWYKTDTDGYQNDGARIGGSWGFVADFFLMENYSFTTGFDIQYINGRINYPVEETTPTGTLDRKLKTRYIQLPLVFTMKTNDIKEKFRVYGQVGYGLGFLLSAKADDEFRAGTGPTIQEEKNVYDEIRFTRSSLILGVGVEIPIYESTYVRTGLKFDNCFVNMHKGSNVVMRNNFIELSAAIIF